MSGSGMQPPSGGSPLKWEAARLTVAHFEKKGLVYYDALSRLVGRPGPLLVKIPAGLASALRCELDGPKEMGMGWEAVADDGLVALLHPNDAAEHRWDALLPHLDGQHNYMLASPERPARSGMNSLWHSTTMGWFARTRGRSSR